MYRKFLLKNKYWLIFIFGGLLSLILYKDTFSSYFFQDDWFSFHISQVQNLSQFLNFFIPRSDVVYYRPLGMQLPFFIMRSLFGLSPLPFRIVTFLLHLFNSLLLYCFLNYFSKNKFITGSCVIAYLISATHITIFYWAATFAFILAPGIYLASILFYVKNKPHTALYLFILGLFVNELIITLPIMICVWSILFKKQIPIKYLLKYGIVVLIYILIRKILFPIQFPEDYKFALSVKELLTNYRNYFLWMFNWPETISDQFVKFFRFNPVFISKFTSHITIYIISTLAWVCSLIFGIFIYKKRHIQDLFFTKNIIFGCLWFLVTLVPVVIFSKHAFTYYSVLPLMGLLIITTNVWEKWFIKIRFKFVFYIIILLILSMWFWSAYDTVQLDKYIHWAPRREKIAYEITQILLKKYPSLPNNAVVLINNDDENKWALGDQNALKVIYHNDTIQTFYGTGKEAQEQGINGQLFSL
jgi:hypothetical protein